MLSLNVASCHGCHSWDVRIIFPSSSAITEEGLENCPGPEINVKLAKMSDCLVST